MPPQVVVILGSASDKEYLTQVSVIFDACKVGYEVSVCSAHRSPDKLRQYCQDNMGARVFIGVAGMAAALPGAIAAHTAGLKPVIGVALPSKEWSDGMDALLSMVRMPPGRPVLVAGIGESGMRNAIIAACQIIAETDAAVAVALECYIKDTTKPPELGHLGN